MPYRAGVINSLVFLSRQGDERNAGALISVLSCERTRMHACMTEVWHRQRLWTCDDDDDDDDATAITLRLFDGHDGDVRQLCVAVRSNVLNAIAFCRQNQSLFKQETPLLLASGRCFRIQYFLPSIYSATAK